ncbi:hypothetical protein [Flavobacterium dankookense]|uniref:Lipoprotein n=1 Tax=Flavobacterium dankookense TaxID=706186 RepID=A0A4R6QBE5_9FLAO|nr:hypothetical protein [Flavobacterium dankookense]TDP59978.1 hypothetical protein BC748_0949 [Flavobacterium dankookense]
MKQVIFIVLSSLLLFSCSLDGEEQQLNLEIVPISQVEMPTAFKVDSITEIPITYIRPTSCHNFANFYYNSLGNERTVAVYCTKINSTECVPGQGNDYILTVPLSFKPKSVGTYHFRFWTGVDANGADQYIEYEAVVNN